MEAWGSHENGVLKKKEDTVGKCQYCGQSAGFFRKNHRECEEIHQSGREKIIEIAQKAAYTGIQLSDLDNNIRAISKSSFIDGTQQKTFLIQAWENAVDAALDDDNVSLREENSLIAFKDYFKLTEQELDTKGAYTKLIKMAVLRNLFEGILPEVGEVRNSLPFNFQKSENVVWVFSNVDYHEQRTRRHYEGGYAGVGVRIAKGLYFRTGGFRSNPVDRRETVIVDNGMFVVTTKHIYFGGENRSFKIPYTKIVSFTPFSDGIGIQRDAMTARLQLFGTGDGWFTYNLISYLARSAIN